MTSIEQNPDKRKLEECEVKHTSRTGGMLAYRPMNFNVRVMDVAKNSEWSLHVEQQVNYFKRRAAVINRWENDIQTYFKQRT